MLLRCKLRYRVSITTASVKCERNIQVQASSILPELCRATINVLIVVMYRCR
jgi:hypothetical protein